MSAPDSTTSRPAEPLRLLAVHAHPDDEASKGAAMMAAYAAAGVEVMVATCTGGEQGSILNPGAENDPAGKRDLAGLRRREMAASQAALGIHHRWLGFADSGLPEGDPLPDLPFGCFALQPLERAAAPLVKLVREFRPHVIVSYDENGGYPHPDHIMAHKVAVEAFEAAGDPERYPGTGPAWEPLKLYYDRAFNPERFRALHFALEEAGLQSPYAERIAASQETDTEGHQPPVPTHPTTTQIECGDFFEVRDQALRSHRTQVDPDGFFFAVSADMQRKVWPWEDYSLIESRVETELPETDLFAGIR
ncbi:mycothiol conjugate amidase Mca [Arthrobacter sp. zg-Y40]|uniref:mycothiol conjugate amidase Mca n=1 Tax=unclassified Arthrobacter TaxID=235627 RepID=UPI001D13F74E|nr:MULTISPECIES: mycothiol conjugate amidase Mca [unclassified Arthrobacter]MCC3277173.1 mycothiol conjugate amidase Mca [Arthrobacter sp. zg-Y20]MCC3280115.1 mycothiol conjugate amidase Mca [Arthrobacter sp. zg-Y40]MDK1317334.1 mycothiol conjugate amidase Mca [Arthrobacter sp. zg.Y20]MDK1328533.1 mycothiol conjugate amidase Mca [Arthrobacter sp. zg-Y1143]WIB07113.1 mycothiol conjugate amidase Mca [Arthrobacter sp. zg-Y20]